MNMLYNILFNASPNSTGSIGHDQLDMQIEDQLDDQMLDVQGVQHNKNQVEGVNGNASLTQNVKCAVEGFLIVSYVLSVLNLQNLLILIFVNAI